MLLLRKCFLSRRLSDYKFLLCLYFDVFMKICACRRVIGLLFCGGINYKQNADEKKWCVVFYCVKRYLDSVVFLGNSII